MGNESSTSEPILEYQSIHVWKIQTRYGDRWRFNATFKYSNGIVKHCTGFNVIYSTPKQVLGAIKQARYYNTLNPYDRVIGA